MKGKQGFSSLTPQRRREVSAFGGKMAHRAGRAHRFTSEEARAAGLKGVAAKRARKLERAQ